MRTSARAGLEPPAHPGPTADLSGTTARGPATDPARRRRPPGPHSTRRGQVRPRERGRRRLRPDDRKGVFLAPPVAHPPADELADDQARTADEPDHERSFP